VGESWLHATVFIEIPEMWEKVDYMKVCVERNLTVGDSCLYEAVCRRLTELWVTVG